VGGRGARKMKRNRRNRRIPLRTTRRKLVLEGEEVEEVEHAVTGELRLGSSRGKWVLEAQAIEEGQLTVTVEVSSAAGRRALEYGNIGRQPSARTIKAADCENLFARSVFECHEVPHIAPGNPEASSVNDGSPLGAVPVGHPLRRLP